VTLGLNYGASLASLFQGAGAQNHTVFETLFEHCKKDTLNMLTLDAKFFVDLKITSRRAVAVPPDLFIKYAYLLFTMFRSHQLDQTSDLYKRIQNYKNSLSSAAIFDYVVEILSYVYADNTSILPTSNATEFPKEFGAFAHTWNERVRKFRVGTMDPTTGLPIQPYFLDNCIIP
jgi:hypothetical protein